MTFFNTYYFYKRFVTFTVFLFLISGTIAQNYQQTIDSLKNELEKVKKLPKTIHNDTIRIRILKSLVDNIYEDEIWGKYNKELISLTKSLITSEKTEIQRKIQLSYALALNDDGLYYENKGNGVEAKKQFYKSLELVEKLNSKEELATVLNNLAYHYKFEGDLVKSLEINLRSLKLREEINDQLGIANSLNNIGLIYVLEGNKKLAKDYFIKSASITEKIDDKYLLSSTYVNLAVIYAGERYFLKAIEFYARAKVLQNQIGDINGVAYTLINMGTVYESMKNFTEAEKLYLEGLQIFENIKSEDGISWAYLNLGNIKFSTGKYDLSRKYLDSSAYFANKINMPEMLKKIESSYYQLDSATGNNLGAFEHYKKFIFFRDGISNQETEKKNLKQRMQFEYEKKESILKEQQHSEKIINQETSRKQQLIIWIIVIILIFVFSITLVIFRSLRTTKKQKIIIEKQKLLVENKQEEILDSIRYARKIQDAILTQQIYIQRNLSRLKNQQ